MTGTKEKLAALGISVSSNSGQVKTYCPKPECEHKKSKNERCLSVNIDKGQYNCHHCGWSGGVKINAPKRTEIEYETPKWTNNTNLPNNVLEWFKKRRISQKILIKQKISHEKEYMPQEKREVPTIQFPYFLNGEVVNVKYRTVDKKFKLVSGAKLILYNLDSIQESKECLIVEGEIDALSFLEAGYDAVLSVPNGASKGNQRLDYIDNCIEQLEKINKFYIGVDNDEPGRALKNELIRRFGDDKCFTLDYKDCKDGNEYLVKYGPLELRALIENAQPVPIEGVFTANDFEKEIEDIYTNGLPKGETIGIDEFDSHISFMPGQMTIITGIPNHGKSEFLDFVHARLAVFKGWRYGIFSPENFPIQLHLSKLIEKIIGKPFGIYGKHLYSRMNDSEKNAAREFINKHFFFIRPDDENFSLDNIIAKTNQLILRHGINSLIIDPWNTLEHQVPKGMNPTEYISNQLSKLTSLKQRKNIHLFIVAHPTKIKKDKNGKYEIPNLYDISGSANFFNKTDNGMCVYRDFDEGKTLVFIQKIKFKHLGKVGRVDFKYDILSGRYNHVDSLEDKSNYLNEQEQKQLKFEEKTHKLTPSQDDNIPDEELEIPF